MNVKDVLNWRYAVKKFSDKAVSDEKLQQVVEAVNLSASSAGLQPYRLVVVHDKALQKRLGEGSFNGQIAGASHLLVFAALENVQPQHITAYMQRIATTRGIAVESLSDFQRSLEGYLLARDQEQNFIWAARQAYIGLGTALVAAASLGVDATPMEGFDAARFDQLLELTEKGLKSVVVLALGYRDVENDVFAGLKKVRLPLEEFVLS